MESESMPLKGCFSGQRLFLSQIMGMRPSARSLHRQTMESESMPLKGCSSGQRLFLSQIMGMRPRRGRSTGRP